MWRFATFLVLACLLVATVNQTEAAPKSRQYVFVGKCNGLDHWVSVRYQPSKNLVTDIIAKATCPHGEPSVSRIIRGRPIAVTVGGQFGRVLNYPGISYSVTGRIHSRSKVSLAFKGPPKLMTCPNDAKQKSVCERFTLKAQ